MNFPMNQNSQTCISQLLFDKCVFLSPFGSEARLKVYRIDTAEESHNIDPHMAVYV